MLLGVWADQAGCFLAWLCAITTVVFAVPITFFPLRWARLMRWRIPAETQLTVYFGRCLGLFILILEGLMARAAWSGEGRVGVRAVGGGVCLHGGVTCMARCAVSSRGRRRQRLGCTACACC